MVALWPSTAAVTAGFGFDTYEVLGASHALGHPLNNMVGFGGIIFNGCVDKFPNVPLGLHGGRHRLVHHVHGAVRSLLRDPPSTTTPVAS